MSVCPSLAIIRSWGCPGIPADCPPATIVHEDIVKEDVLLDQVISRAVNAEDLERKPYNY